MWTSPLSGKIDQYAALTHLSESFLRCMEACSHETGANSREERYRNLLALGDVDHGWWYAYVWRYVLVRERFFEILYFQ